MLQTSHILEMAKRLREMRMPPKNESIVDSIAEKAAEEGTDELVKQYKEDTPGQGKEVKEATTGDKEEYQKKRRAVAKKFGVTSCSQLDDPEKKKACYAALDAAHVSDEEEDEDDDPVGKNEEVEVDEGIKPGQKVNFDDVVVKEPSRDGKSTFVVVSRDTKGMRGKQDDYSMYQLDKSGKVLDDLGSHPSLNGAKKYVKAKATNREVDEAVEIQEAWVAGAVYHQEFNNGDRAYFRADTLLKNKRWKGMTVDEFGGKQKKPKNITADEKVQGWKETPKNEIPKGLKEEVEIDEKRSSDYQLYHKTFSGAMQHAYAHAKKKGFTVDNDEIDSKVATGPKKPSSGKTNRYILGTDKKKNLHVQVANLDNKRYELNMYIEGVEIAEAVAGWIAIYNREKLEIKKDKANGIYGAKQIAIKHFKIPKSKESKLSIGPAHEEVEIDEVLMVRTQKVEDGYKWLVQKVEYNKTEIMDTGVEASRVKANIAGRKAKTKITEHCGSCGEGEGIDEAKRKSKKDYEIYHKSYSGAVQHAADVAKRQGYEVDQDSWDSEITHGQRKPSEGKTVIKKIKLTKDGKPQRKMLQIQVHGMRTQYELNMYIESVGNPYSMVRRLKWGLNEGEKGVTDIKRGYLTHVKEFLPELQAGIKKVIPGVKLAPHSINPRSESGKTIPGLGLVLSGYDEPTIMIQWDERIGSNPSRVSAIARGKNEVGYDPKTHREHTFTVWINEAASAKGSAEKGRVDWYPRQYYNEYKRVVQYLKTKVKRGVTRKEEVDIGEKINLARSKMGAVVKDFQDSDAPQFNGKSDKKRKEMAIAAKLDADRKEEYGQEDKPKSKKKDKINLKPKMDETMKTLKDIRNSQVKMDEIRWDLKDKGPEPAAELIKSAGKQLKDYALKSGGIDKKDFLATADILLKGKIPTEKQIPSDTAPNEFVHSLLARKFGWKYVEQKYGIKFNNRKPFPEEVEVDEGRGKVALECQECGKKFSKANPNSSTKCPKCKSTDVDIDYAKKEEVELEAIKQLAERKGYSNFRPFPQKVLTDFAKRAKKAGLGWEAYKKFVKQTFKDGADENNHYIWGRDVYYPPDKGKQPNLTHEDIQNPKVNEAVTALGIEYEESDFDGPHRLETAYPNLNTNFAKYMDEDLEGPYEVSGEVYFYDRKVNMFYSVSGEDFVDEETGKELAYRLHKNGMYKIELGR